jgi:hypothetical protein
MYMNDEIMNLLLCGRLMSEKGIGESDLDQVRADNILYGAFGMSSEEILENLRSGNIDNAALFY